MKRQDVEFIKDTLHTMASNYNTLAVKYSEDLKGNERQDYTKSLELLDNELERNSHKGRRKVN